jgi:hypothetical protein
MTPDQSLPSVEQIAQSIVNSSGLTIGSTRTQLVRAVADAVQAERDRFDARTNEALQLFGESQIKMIAESFEKAGAYTNLVMLAGYAGLFALWQFTKEHLSRDQTIWVALFILLSIAIFVLYEVFKSWSINRQLIDYASVFRNPQNTASAEAMIATLQKLDKDKRMAGIIGQRFWMLAYFATLVTGLAAAFVLLYAFLRLLIG